MSTRVAAMVSFTVLAFLAGLCQPGGASAVSLQDFAPRRFVVRNNTESLDFLRILILIGNAMILFSRRMKARSNVGSEA